MQNIFKITIGSSPQTLHDTDCTKHLNHDLQLIKAALLYSDKVEICSPMGNLIHSVNSIRQLAISSKFEDKLRLLDRLLTYNFARPEVAQFVTALKALQSKKHLSGQEIVLKKKLVNEINRVWKNFQKEDFEFVSGDEIKHLLKLYEQELIEYYFFDVTSENVGEELLKQFTDFITNSISDPYSYPLLDDVSGLYISDKISRGELAVKKSDLDRSKHVSLASELFERLPNFDLATIDEILDIRNELNPFLSRFRASLIELANMIKNPQWSLEFEKDVEVIFRENIEPIVDEIEENIKSKSYLKSLISRFSGNPERFQLPIFGVTITGQIANYEILSIIIDSIILGANLFDVYNKLEKEKLEIKQNHLFFYYRAGKLLSK